MKTQEINSIRILSEPFRISSDKAGSAYFISKRLIDIGGASLLIVLSSPVWIALAIMIKAHSKGPSIIKQERVGLQGKKFVMYKFRTMHIHAPLYAKSP